MILSPGLRMGIRPKDNAHLMIFSSVVLWMDACLFSTAVQKVFPPVRSELRFRRALEWILYRCSRINFPLFSF